MPAVCGMRLFRCYFLDERDHIAAEEDIEVETLSDAIELAVVMLQSRSQHRAVEIWEGGTKVYPAPDPV